MGGGNGQTIHIGFAGDLLVGRKVSRTVVAGQQPEEMWGDLRPRMLATDAMIANLEAPITTHLVKWHKLKSFYLRADPAVIPSLSAGNIRCVSLANNHILDFGDQGLLDTRRHLEAAGIAFAGAGANADEAKAPVVFTAGQARIGLISITDNIPAFRATDDRPGTNYWKIRTDAETMVRLSGLIDGLRAAGADLIVLSTHWGINYRWWPPQGHRVFARQAIERGVDIVHGHSAHLFQAVEFHRRGLILYDTGDFIEDLIVPPGFRSDHSFLFLVDIADGRVARLRMVPARLTLAKVNTARGHEAEVIRRAMIKRCRGFAVDIREEDGDLVATPPGTADG